MTAFYESHFRHCAIDLFIICRTGNGNTQFELLLFKIFLFCFRASTPHSDTESSDEDDDVSDHDLTPCNPSPNMSQLLGKSFIMKILNRGHLIHYFFLKLFIWLPLRTYVLHKVLNLELIFIDPKFSS